MECIVDTNNYGDTVEVCNVSGEQVPQVLLVNVDSNSKPQTDKTVFAFIGPDGRVVEVPIPKTYFEALTEDAQVTEK